MGAGPRSGRLDREACRSQRPRVPAKRQQTVESRPELGTKAVQARVRDRDETVELDQISRAPHMLIRGEKGAGQPEGRKDPQNPAAANVRRRLCRQQGPVVTGLLLRAAADRERVGTVGAGVAASAEGEAGDN